MLSVYYHLPPTKTLNLPFNVCNVPDRNNGKQKSSYDGKNDILWLEVLCRNVVDALLQQFDATRNVWVGRR